MDKYTWQEVGSSFLPGELIAAFLWAQLEEAQSITDDRMASWDWYHAALAPLEARGLLRRPVVPEACQHNAHMYYVLLSPELDRQSVLSSLKERGVSSVFHYVPLHSAPAGVRYGRAHGSMEFTNNQSARLIRLPLWVGLTLEQRDRVVTALTRAVS